jgi:hypothetical protein
LRDVRLLGGAGKGKRFGDGAEVAKLVEFHGWVVCVERCAEISSLPAVMRFSPIGCAYPLYPN